MSRGYDISDFAAFLRKYGNSGRDSESRSEEPSRRCQPAHSTGSRQESRIHTIAQWIRPLANDLPQSQPRLLLAGVRYQSGCLFKRGKRRRFGSLVGEKM